MANDIRIDFSSPLPPRWRPVPGPRGPIEIQQFAPLLKLLRDEGRERFGAAYASGLVTGRFVVAGIKGMALDMLAGQIGEVEGRAFAVAIQRLVVTLTVDDDGGE